MARRRELKGIANGLLSSFTSKNNIINEEWVIDQLYKFMQDEQTTEIMIDLMQRKIAPYNPVFNEMIAIYSEKLYEQIENRTMNLNFVISARIFCKGVVEESRMSGPFCFEEMQSQMIIVDDLRKNHIVEKKVVF